MDVLHVFNPQVIAAIIGGFIGGLSAIAGRRDYGYGLKLSLLAGSVIIAAGICDVLKVRIGLESFWLTLFLGYLIGIPSGNVVEAMKSASPRFAKRLVKVAEGKIIDRANGEL
jgi:hypothetical protein